MKPLLNIVYGAIIGMFLAGVLWVVTGPPFGQSVTLMPLPTPLQVTVYVTGAVAHQGVYSFPEGSRIADAIEAAGGFLPIADTEVINLAAVLHDGQQVDVPRLGSSSVSITSRRININTATAEELDALPGIGSSLAKSIVEYRQKNGSFQTIEELMGVPGIGPATFERIKNLITVGY